MNKLIIHKGGFTIKDRVRGVTQSLIIDDQDEVLKEVDISSDEVRDIFLGEKSVSDILEIHENNSSVRTNGKTATREQHEGVEDNESVSAGQGGLSVSITSKAGQDRIRRP